MFVTLRKGLARRPADQRAVVEALGLKKRHDCVEKPNNAYIRGMLAKVSPDHDAFELVVSALS